MATATSRRAAPDKKVLERRRKLALERLDIERRLEPDNTRIAEIEAELKKIATDAGDSFREQFPDGSYVNVDPGHAAEFKGNVPQIQTEKWNTLAELERKRILKTGAVKIVSSFGKASNGRVTVKVL